MAKEKLSFEDKVRKEMPEFVEEVVGCSIEQLNARLAAIAKAQQENDEKQEADEKLESAKAKAREMGQVYSEPRKALKKKTKYLVLLIKEKGGQ